MISAIAITATFVVVIVLMVTEKVNRAVLALVGALVTFLTLVLLEGDTVLVFIDLTFSLNDDFVNLKAIVLIIGMLLVIQVCQQAGLFQFLAFTIVKATGVDARRLLATMCLLTVFMAAILNNVLTLVILIPLTVMIARILNVDPKPYIMTQAVIANMGATLFSISSIPNILISTKARLSFVDFFVNVGILSIIVAIITIAFFLILFKNKLGVAEKNVEILREFDAWTFISNRRLLYKATFVLAGVMVGFVVIPADVVSPDLIAITGALVLILISKLNAETIISKLDVELLLFLIGIFFMTGALERTGVLDLIGTGLFFLSAGDPFLTNVIVLWISAYASSNLDNISITKVMMPPVELMTSGLSPEATRQAYYSLVFGAGWGDNLSPMGDNVVVMNLSAQNKVPITFKDLFKLGFMTTNFQLVIITAYLAVLSPTPLALLVLACIGAGTALILIASKAGWTRRPRSRAAANGKKSPFPRGAFTPSKQDERTGLE